MIAGQTYTQKQVFDEPQWKINLYFEEVCEHIDTVILKHTPNPSQEGNRLIK